MTAETFLIILAILATITSLCTEAVKKFLSAQNINYAANIVVLIISAIVGGLGTVIFYMYSGIEFTSLNIINIFLMIAANWLGAMLGYDKVMQAIAQMKSK